MTTAPQFVPGRRFEQLLRPVPALVADAVGEVAAQHAALAKRYGESRARAVALRTKLVETERADEVAAHKAIASGAPMPKAKAPKLADDLAEAEREIETVADLIVPSSRALLEASADVALEVEERADADADAAVEAVLDHLRAARELLDSEAELREQAAWCLTLREDGIVHPFTSSGASGKSGGAIDDAIRRVEDERERREQYAAEREHELRALNVVRRGDQIVELPPPPREEVAAS